MPERKSLWHTKIGWNQRQQLERKKNVSLIWCDDYFKHEIRFVIIFLCYVVNMRLMFTYIDACLCVISKHFEKRKKNDHLESERHLSDLTNLSLNDCLIHCRSFVHPLLLSSSRCDRCSECVCVCICIKCAHIWCACSFNVAIKYATSPKSNLSCTMLKKASNKHIYLW